MAAIAAIVVAIVRSGWRTLRSARSFTGNNLVALIALLMAAEPASQPSSTAVLYLIVGLLWVLPMSRELTRRIPAVRFHLWPLSWWRKKTIIYALNLLLNPLIAIAILFGVLSRDRQVGLGLAEIGAVAPLAILAAGELDGAQLGLVTAAVHSASFWAARRIGVESHPRTLATVGFLLRADDRNRWHLLYAFQREA